MTFLKLTLFGALIFTLMSCTTTPVEDGGNDIGVWEGKVKIVNRSKRTKHLNKKWANVTWVSDSSQQRLRVNVIAAFDTPVATFLMDEDRAHLWIFNDKKYYTSTDPEKLFKNLVKFSVQPKIFFSLLGDIRKLGNSWKCKNASQAMVCKNVAKSLQFEMKNPEPDRRNLSFKKGRKALQLHLVRSKVEVNDKMFRPLSSSHFEKIEI